MAINPFFSLACGCKSGYALNGTRCVPVDQCICWDDVDNVARKPYQKWSRGCLACHCMNNQVVCKSKCTTLDCPDVSKSLSRLNKKCLLSYVTGTLTPDELECSKLKKLVLYTCKISYLAIQDKASRESFSFGE